MNSFGNLLRLTTFGESHGVAVGGVLDGFPAGVDVDMLFIQSEVNRRRPGQSIIGYSPRKEDDNVQLLSGVFEGKTLGTPIAFIISNNDKRSDDYELFKDVYRPGHADFTYQEKYGIRDYRGGGRASARETVCRVVAGAFAKLALKKVGIEISAAISNEKELKQRISEAIKDIDTCGGIVSCRIKGCPAGLGEPIYDKVQAALASAMLSINAVKGFEYGEGFAAAEMRGSEHNVAQTGGMLGGITDGTDITFKVAFKPIPSLGREMKGRHDVCAAPRAVPIVEAMAALVILDFYLIRKSQL